MAAEDCMYRLPSADVWAAGLVLLLLTGVGRMSKIKHNIADALRGRGERFAPLSKDETPIDRLYRLIRPGWQVSPELDQLFRAMVHKDPMMRPSAEEVLACDWMKKADEVTSDTARSRGARSIEGATGRTRRWGWERRWHAGWTPADGSGRGASTLGTACWATEASPTRTTRRPHAPHPSPSTGSPTRRRRRARSCLLYTSDAADE